MLTFAGEQPAVVRAVRTIYADVFAQHVHKPGRGVHGALTAVLGRADLHLFSARPLAREARRLRGQAIGRPKALDKSKVGLARRMHASGESPSTIASTLGVSRATVYRVLAEQTDDAD